MNIEGGLFTDLVVIFAVAAAGGLAARMLRLSVRLGYIALGILIGPDVLGFVDDPERVETFSNLGVILLLFAIGIEIPFREIYQLTRVVVGAGVIQIVLTASAVYPIFPFQSFADDKKLLDLERRAIYETAALPLNYTGPAAANMGLPQQLS